MKLGGNVTKTVTGSKVKVGDKFKWTRPDGIHFRNGEVYTVSKVIDDGNVRFEGVGGEWYTWGSDFDRVEERFNLDLDSSVAIVLPFRFK